MSGDNKHRIGQHLADGFDLITDSFSIMLQNMSRESFIRVQRLPKENGWLTRCLEYQDDKLVSLFFVTDKFYPDKNILLRSISTTTKLIFNIDIHSKERIFHEKYALRKHRFPAIQILWNGKVIYLFLSGDMSYDPYSCVLQIKPGEHELVFCIGNNPKDILRYTYSVLVEGINPEPVEIHQGELANAIDTAESALQYDKNYILAYSAKRLGLKAKLPELSFDENSIIHGMLPCRDSDDGSSIDTILYIKSKGEESVKNMFKENFVHGDKILLNSRKRRELCRMPRFRYGVCQYCKGKETWLEKTVHSSYACAHCYNEANIPSNIPEFKEYVSDIPLLLIIYLGLDIPTFDDIPTILQRISERDLDSLTLGLLLYAVCKYDLSEKHTLYQRLISQRNDIGIWHGETDCCPTTNAICAVAITEYKRTE